MAGNTFVEKPQIPKTAPRSPEGSSIPQRDGYWGSVRFFKHLILVTLALFILIPTLLSILFGVSLGRTRAELADLRQSMRQPPQPTPPEDGPPAQSGPPPEETPGGIGRDGGPQPEVPSYQSLYPDVYAQPVERNSVDEEKVVYITFDDGPSEQTPELLEILECYDIKATFFVVGKECGLAKQWLRDIAEAGHTIGVHSYTHEYTVIYDSVEAYLDDFVQEYRLIQEATGQAPQIFRFPGGSINAYNGPVYQEIISEMTRRGFVYFDWNRQTGDSGWCDISAEKMAENALDQAGSMRRVFLLTHDNVSSSNIVEALPRIIEGFQEEGFSFAALTPEVKPVIFGYAE